MVPRHIQTNSSVTTLFSDRHGGVSSPPYDSLNFGLHVGDERSAVNQNRKIVKEMLGVRSLLSAKQVHGDHIHLTRAVPQKDAEIEGVDALMTREKGVGLVIQQADCQGILLHDPKNEVVAAIHCGWRGTVADIIGKTVLQMTDSFSSRPKDILASISPSLGPCCAEFLGYKEELPEELHSFKDTRNHFNFWEISIMQLERAGLASKHVSVSGKCTACDENYFSYRRAVKKTGGITGRNISAIALR